MLKEKKIPPWTEIVLVPKTGKASLYPGLFLFTAPCRMMRPVRNLALGKQELIGTFEQVCVNYDVVVILSQYSKHSTAVKVDLFCILVAEDFYLIIFFYFASALHQRGHLRE